MTPYGVDVVHIGISFVDVPYILISLVDVTQRHIVSYSDVEQILILLDMSCNLK